MACFLANSDLHGEVAVVQSHVTVDGHGSAVASPSAVAQIRPASPLSTCELVLNLVTSTILDRYLSIIDRLRQPVGRPAADPRQHCAMAMFRSTIQSVQLLTVATDSAGLRLRMYLGEVDPACPAISPCLRVGQIPPIEMAYANGRLWTRKPSPVSVIPAALAAIELASR